MARVAVLHNTLDFHGGADAVALTVCDALAESHDVDLFTVSETDPSDLAPQFGLTVDVPVREPPGADRIARAFAAAVPRLGPQLAARSVLLERFFRRHADGYDLAVSTANEFDLPLPSVQYLHFPQFNLARLPLGYEDAGRLNPLWSRLAGPRPDRGPANATLVANSGWTADAVEVVYGRRPTVVHPPVAPIEGRRPWDDRERGVVVVGRIAPDRRVLDAVEVVDRVRDRGHDLHLHLVGAAPPAYRSYVRRVRAAVRDREYAHLETDVSRARLEELLCTHRYGLNAKRHEHFGIAVAEYVAAGMVAFAPDSGGQRDVLDGRPDRLFGSVDEAVDLVSAAIETGARPRLRPDRFGHDRFRSAVRGLVADALDD